MVIAIARAAGAAAITAATLAVSLCAQAEVQVRVVTFEYEATSGLLKKETIEPNQASVTLVTEYTLDAYGNRTAVNVSGPTSGAGSFTARGATSTLASGSFTVAGMTYTHSAGQFATGAVNPAGHAETRAFDPRTGQAVSVTDPNGLTAETRYDIFGRKIKERSPDATGRSIEYVYCTGAGVTIPSGAASEACPTVSVYGGSQTFTPAYFVRVTPLKGLTNIDAAGAVNGPVAKVFHDSLNREVRRDVESFDAAANPPAVLKDTQYDADGRVKRVSRPYYTGSTVYWAVTQDYDALGRVTRKIDATNAATNLEVLTIYSGLTGTARVAVGSTVRDTVTERDSLGRNLKVTDADGKILTFAYDAAGNLTSTTDHANNVTTLTYDVRGRKTGMTDRDMGSWSYTYNALGEMLTQTDALGQVTTMTYDLLGRMTARSVGGVGGNPGMSAQWFYDAYPSGGSAPPSGFTNDLVCNNATGGSRTIGKLCYASTDTGYLRAHSYDSLGRPDKTRSRLDSSGADYLATTTYNDGGRVAGLTYPSSVKVKIGYTARGYLRDVRRDNPGVSSNTGGAHNADNQLLWQANTMSAEGQLLQTQQGHGVVTNNNWQATSGRLLTQTAGTGNNILNLAYSHDVYGNLATRNDDARGLNETFTYDVLNRLKTAQLQGSGVTGINTTEWTYNAIGNIVQRDTTQSVGGSTTTSTLTYAYNASGANSVRPHAVIALTGTIDWEGGSNTQQTNPTFTYDANGNMLQDANRAITWGAFNLPTRTTGANRQVDFNYDAEYQRIKQVVTNPSGGNATPSTVHYLNPPSGGGLFYEKECLPTCTAGSQARERHYIAAGGTTIGVIIINTPSTAQGGAATESIQYWHQDHLGSTVAVTKPDTANPTTAYQLCETFRYAPFGGRTVMTNNGCDTVHPTDRGFTGHEHIEEMNLVHMNGRVYDPVLNRFLSPDPVVQSPNNLQNYNRYSYTLNNPLGYTDPSGYFIEWVIAAIFIAEGLKQLDVIDSGTARLIQGLAAGYIAGPYALGSSIAGGAVGGFVTGLVASNGNLEVAFQGAFTGGLFGAASTLSGAAQYGLHAAAGCISGEMSGGGCGRGAASALVGKFITLEVANNLGPVGKGFATVIAGGTASVIGGGKFSNGAFSAGFGYLFNACGSGQCGSSPEENGAPIGSSVEDSAAGLKFARSVVPGGAAAECYLEGCTGLGLAIAAVDAIPGGGKGVSLGMRGLGHVIERHSAGGLLSAGKSTFNVGEDFYALAAKATSVNAIPSGRNFVRVVDAGRPIGIDRISGQATSTYSVVTNRAGNVVTMHPGRP